jgi:hypothetical protein
MELSEREKQLQKFVSDLRNGRYDHIIDFNMRNWTWKMKSYAPHDPDRKKRNEYQRAYYAKNFKAESSRGRVSRKGRGKVPTEHVLHKITDEEKYYGIDEDETSER